MFFFLACGGDDSGTAATTTTTTTATTGTTATTARQANISLMTGGPAEERRILERIISDYEAKNPNVKVELIMTTIDSEQRRQSIITALRGRQTKPDFFTMDVAWIGQIAASDWLANLTPYNIDTSPFYQGIIELANTYRGNLVALPNFVDGGLLYYRTDLLEKYGYSGPPKTWGELAEMAVKIQAGERAEGRSDFWGFTWQGRQYEGLICDALEFFVSANGGFLDRAGNSILDSAENVKALTFMRDLIHEYRVSPPNTYTDMAEEESRRVWHFGNAAFHRNWPYAIGISRDADDSAVKGKFNIGPLPHFPGGQSASTLGGWHMGVSTFSQEKDATVEFMKYYTSFDVQKMWLLDLGFFAPRPAVFDDPEVKQKLPHLVALKDVFEGAVPRPNVPYYNEMSDVMQRYFNAALARSMTVEDALRRAHNEVTAIMREYQ